MTVRQPIRTGAASVPGAVGLLRQISEDLDAVVARDPSCRSRREAMLRGPWQGLAIHRAAHRLYRRGFRCTAAALTWISRVISGMELSPGARLGRRLFIDHGVGVGASVLGPVTVADDCVIRAHDLVLTDQPRRRQ